ncbi:MULTISPECIES: Na-translocating system protein MpsC family protein [unclassified Desulfosporosinus]|uniref:Na-translocating system protein MpsC family protein n=1 Tax=unclassified Desulfosporosinus TaxID=2633794 RepID=UPI00031E0291|nr:MULTISPECIES: Na-translocating system protein MpsC family protein [unclassified Desulfosporosinus]ODA40862.1 hypothetical protein DSBG_2303 [Desulfosporosinus sp. BG]
MAETLTELKQAVMRIYNSVNQEMYEIGVKRLRVDIVGKKIVILAEHRRLPGLRALDQINRSVTRMADVALLDLNKLRLKTMVESELNLKVISVLKDYDPEQEIAATVIVLHEQLSDT